MTALSARLPMTDAVELQLTHVGQSISGTMRLTALGVSCPVEGTSSTGGFGSRAVTIK